MRTPDLQQLWLTFLRNHAKVIVACDDFFMVITATFLTLYVFGVIEIGSRKILHQNATAHPTAAWTLQQFQEALPDGHPYRFLIHDRDRIFAREVDQGLANQRYEFFADASASPHVDRGVRATGREPSSRVFGFL